jgi:hypothetical protein
METCNKCKHWEKPDGYYGLCQKLEKGSGVFGAYDEISVHNAERGIMTGSHFGCVHHEHINPMKIGECVLRVMTPRGIAEFRREYATPDPIERNAAR